MATVVLALSLTGTANATDKETRLPGTYIDIDLGLRRVDHAGPKLATAQTR